MVVAADYKSTSQREFVCRLDERLECPICKNVFTEPWQTSCGHIDSVKTVLKVSSGKSRQSVYADSGNKPAPTEPIKCHSITLSIVNLP